MNVICYGHPPDEMFLTLWDRIRKTNLGSGLELHRSLRSFEARLRQPGMDSTVVMLYLSDKEALSDLRVVRPLLNDLSLVILLNDQEPEILRFCHELRPRVIIYTCWSVADIYSVLQRCISRFQS